MMTEDVLAHVGANVRRLRAESGLTQTALAEAAGVSRRMIASLEIDGANISLAKLSLIASVLGVDFTTIVSPPERLGTGAPDVVTWRGSQRNSHARLHCSARASQQVELWTWVLAPGERYDAESDPPGRSEMLYVICGELTLELPDGDMNVSAGSGQVFSSSVQYAYANRSDAELRFVRNVVR